MEYVLIAAPIIGVVALLFAFYKASSISKMEAGNERMIEISTYIQDGSMAFLKRQYSALAVFVVVLFIILAVVPDLGLKVAICFLIGALFSMFAGYFGMRVATRANVRTANAAMKGGMTKALNVAFSGGAVMGMTVVGLGLIEIGRAHV